MVRWAEGGGWPSEGQNDLPLDVWTPFKNLLSRVVEANTNDAFVFRLQNLRSITVLVEISSVKTYEPFFIINSDNECIRIEPVMWVSHEVSK